MNSNPFRQLASCIMIATLLIGCRPPREAPPSPPTSAPAPTNAPPPTTAPHPTTAALTTAASTKVSWVDVHTHPTGSAVTMGSAGHAVCDSKECVDRIIATMDKYGIQKAVLMNPPAPAGVSGTENELLIAKMAQSQPDRFAYSAGGSAINPLIQQAGKTGSAPADLQQKLKDYAKQLIDAGAIGFGETAVLHLSAATTHAFEEVPADSPMFLLLADLAAQYDEPLDVHMDAVLSDGATPDEFIKRSSLNPKTLKGNIVPFEKLLNHNKKARIVLAHVSWDHIGDMTADRVRQLLEKHPNFYVQLRIATGRVGSNSVLDEKGNIRAEWLNVFKAYPDRFVLGTDTFYGGTEIDEKNIAAHEAFVEQLPSDLSKKIGCENASTIYKLKLTCK